MKMKINEYTVYSNLPDKTDLRKILYGRVIRTAGLSSAEFLGLYYNQIKIEKMLLMPPPSPSLVLSYFEKFWIVYFSAFQKWAVVISVAIGWWGREMKKKISICEINWLKEKKIEKKIKFFPLLSDLNEKFTWGLFGTILVPTKPITNLLKNLRNFNFSNYTLHYRQTLQRN